MVRVDSTLFRLFSRCIWGSRYRRQSLFLFIFVSREIPYWSLQAHSSKVHWKEDWILWTVLTLPQYFPVTYLTSLSLICYRSEDDAHDDWKYDQFLKGWIAVFYSQMPINSNISDFRSILYVWALPVSWKNPEFNQFFIDFLFSTWHVFIIPVTRLRQTISWKRMLFFEMLVYISHGCLLLKSKWFLL